MVPEQKARATYDNILRISDDPDVNNVIRFLREREVVHFQRFGDTILTKLRGFWGVRNIAITTTLSISPRDTEAYL